MTRLIAAQVLPESLPYWQAADRGELLLKGCRACGQVHHYPRDVCPFCLSADTEWVPASGRGTLYSYSTMGAGDKAYTLAYVTLAEGVTLMTRMVDCDPAQLHVDMPVRVVFRPSQGGPAVPVFAPA
ncbi:OB-fold domain-containing protein [Ramlibacter sp. AW1]|uniref:OB-fold domain-containing protein n=1 Tax=Ramlibacter aurantiacus TaxID=2801330 RepID=A0A936ZLZ3_9BURK|nr:OB-fold domain-containing protein [Ramlibacter aurantiacus]MBL0419695.1 OB-fold domain-containing protein [Ramlibacter aurantiacus]